MCQHANIWLPWLYLTQAQIRTFWYTTNSKWVNLPLGNNDSDNDNVKNNSSLKMFAFVVCKLNPNKVDVF